MPARTITDIHENDLAPECASLLSIMRELGIKAVIESEFSIRMETVSDSVIVIQKDSSRS